MKKRFIILFPVIIFFAFACFYAIAVELKAINISDLKTVQPSVIEVELLNQVFVRQSGTPYPVTINFISLEGECSIILNNGSEDSTVEKVSSSIISINEKVIFDESNFNQNVFSLTKTALVNNGDNALSVLLKGKPGGTIRIRIVQYIQAEGAKALGSTGGSIEVNNPSSPLHGAKIEIPENAISSTQIIIFKAVEKGTTPSLEYFPPGPEIEFFPDGMAFNIPVNIYLPYNDADNNGILDGTIIPVDEIRAQYFNRQVGLWEDVEITNIDREKKRVCIQTTHFSSYRTYIHENPLNKNLYLKQTRDNSGKFAILQNITEQGSNYVEADLKFVNNSGAWILVSPSYNDPNYVNFDKIFLVPPVYATCNTAHLGKIRFEEGQHIELCIQRNMFDQQSPCTTSGSIAPFVATAIDLIMRGIFSTRLDICVADTYLMPLIEAVSSSGANGKLGIMVYYLKEGKEHEACLAAIDWLFTVDREKLAAVFRHVFNIEWAYQELMAKGLENCLQAISLFEKYYLMKELCVDYATSPFDGFVRLELASRSPIYSNQTLSGNWLLGDSSDCRYLSADGNGTITDFNAISMASPPGLYNVNSNGTLSVTLKMINDPDLTCTGSFNDPNSGSITIFTTTVPFSKVTDISLCQGTYSGTTSKEEDPLNHPGIITTHTYSFTVNSIGEISNFTMDIQGVTGSGKAFAIGSLASMKINTNAAKPYDQMSLWGTLTNGQFTGSFGNNHGSGTGQFSFSRTKN